MREDFMMSMKKAIVDFVLKDPDTVTKFKFFCTSSYSGFEFLSSFWGLL